MIHASFSAPLSQRYTRAGFLFSQRLRKRGSTVFLISRYWPPPSTDYRADTVCWSSFLVTVLYTAALVPSLWLQTLPICDISNCWDKSKEEISLWWEDKRGPGWQLCVLLSLQVRGLQEKPLIYCTVSQKMLGFQNGASHRAVSLFQKAIFDEMERFH